jgi:peptidyl-prolyl cis-trans isomerase B (cyclophilin B)
MMKNNVKVLVLMSALVGLLVGCSEPATDPVETPSEMSAPDAATETAEVNVPVPMQEQEPTAIEVVESGVDKSNPGWKQNLSQPGLMSFEAGKSYYWDMQTNKGPMSFRLFHETAPAHATSTVYLTELGFYDDVVFHRVIPGFMAQGGDPTGTGRGGPGYNYAGEFSDGVSHDRMGLLSMANAGPNTDGSQFFITFVPTPFLDGKHTVFGEMVEGKETLGMFETMGSRSGKTSELLQISKATIRVE